MKVLAFNSSPNMGNGNTALILDPFLSGMKQAGADLELFYINELNIKPCLAEASCTTKHPGRCIQNDDMNMLLPKVFDADIMVIASPLYFDGVSGPMKNLIDRMLPIGRSYYEMRNGHLRLGLAKGFKRKKVVLVATCGLWEMDNFDSMVHYTKAVCAIMDSEFSGALLRPHANFLSTMGDGPPISEIVNSARQAGDQLVTNGEIPSETLQLVSQELMTIDKYRQETNSFLKGLQSA